MPPMPPDYGSGPVNYANQNANDPFAAFDNRIRYQDMARHQLVSQYQQNAVRPHTMTLSQAREVATQKRFQYGVPGGQDPRMYERNAELSRMAYGTSLAKGIVDIGMWGAAEAGAMGMSMGFAGSMMLPLAATLAPMHFVGKGVQNAVDRRKYMHSIASDVEQYRDQLGFKGGGLSYSQATELGKRMESGMSSPGQFFSREQQSRIHKIALSNNLISSKGKGIDSGTIQSYERNFKELIDTTEDIVKLLQTTTEGGMSIIKELQQKGFGNIKQIRQQVVQAKALGGMTGIGSQNMMQLGAAGAQAAQGTPWAANVGASMYQMGAVEASTMAKSGKAGAYAVRRAGGTAAAGAAIGNFAMNMMQSGIGTKLAAYAMKGDGSVDQNKLDRMLSGKAGAYEIVTGANQSGYAMGENRVRFGMFKEDLLNQMSDRERMQMVSAGFNAWSKQRPYSSVKNRAWVFAGNYTNDTRSQRLMYQNLMTAKDYGTMAARGEVERGLIDERAGGAIGVGRAYKKFEKKFTGFFDRVGEGIVQTSEAWGRDATEVWGDIKGGVGYAFEEAIKGAGIAGPQGFIDRTNYAATRPSYENLYGLRGATGIQSAALRRATMDDIKNLKSGEYGGFDASSIINKWKKAGNYEYAVQRLAVIGGSRDFKQFGMDPRLLEGFTKDEIAGIKAAPQAAYLGLGRVLDKHSRSIHAGYEDAVGAVNTSEKMENRSAKQKRIDDNFERSTNAQMEDGRRINLAMSMSAGVFKNREAVYEKIEGKWITGEGKGQTYYQFGRKGEEITSAGIVTGAKGVSDLIVKKQKAKDAALALGPLVGNITRQMVASAEFAAKPDYAGALGVGRDAPSMLDTYNLGTRGRTQWNLRTRRLEEKFGDRYDFRKEKGQEEFAMALLRAKSGGTVEDQIFLGDASKILTGEGMKKVQDEAARKSLAEGATKAKLRTVNFMSEMVRDNEAYKKLSTGAKKEIAGVMTKAHMGKLTDEEFETIKTHKGIIRSGFSGADTVVNEFFDTKQDFISGIYNKVKSNEKDSGPSRLDKIKTELGRVREALIKGTGGKFNLYDGKDEVEIEKKGLTGRGERREQLKAAERALQSEWKDEQMYMNDSQTNTMNATVKSPVLNYWNNRWVL